MLAALALTLGGAPACAGAPALALAPRRLAGQVMEVDLGAGRIVIEGAGRRRAVLVAVDTIVRRAGAAAPLGSLRRGDRVVVALRQAPPHVARAIAVAGPPTAPARARR